MFSTVPGALGWMTVGYIFLLALAVSGTIPAARGQDQSTAPGPGASAGSSASASSTAVGGAAVGSATPLAPTPSSTTPATTTPVSAGQQTGQLAVIPAVGGRAALGPGDLVHIEVFDVPDFTRDVRVDDSGDISIPLLPGLIHAGGLTPYQLQSKIANLLLENGLVSHPQVSVTVREQQSEPISILGAVNHPGVYQEVRATTLLEILALAGGLSADAGDVILITRPTASHAQSSSSEPPSRVAASSSPGSADGQATNIASSATRPVASDPAVEPLSMPLPASPQTMTVRVRDLLQSGDPALNLPVHGGDVISIPRAGIVYVAGAVQMPGGFTLFNGEPITTLKAMALAHGLAIAAKPNQAVIVRRDPNTGAKQEIVIPLKKIMARKVDDVRLFPNDVLFVPDSPGKKALLRAGEAAIAVSTGLAIYRGGQ